MEERPKDVRFGFKTEAQRDGYIKAGPKNMDRVRRGFDKEVCSKKDTKS